MPFFCHDGRPATNFSNCIQERRDPEPSGLTGMADVRIFEALLRSASGGMLVVLDTMTQEAYPDAAQEIHRPPVAEPEIIHVDSAAR